jgi:hypothetical protein
MTDAKVELKWLRELSDRLLPDRGGFTVRQAGKDVTLQQRAILMARISQLESERANSKCERCETRE